MIYSDNLCELIKLIAESRESGVYYPQQERYISTSELFHDIGKYAGHKVHLTKLFNPILRLLSPYIGTIRKVFGSEAYELSMSNHFDGAYRVVNYDESVKRIALAKKAKN